MNKIADAWKMTKLSGRVLKKYPFLMGYVALAALVAGVLVAGVLSPVAFNAASGKTQLLEPYAQFTEVQNGKAVFPSHGAKYDRNSLKAHWGTLVPVGVVVGFGGEFLIILLNVAFLISVKRILNGKEVTFKEGLALAWEKRAAVLQWALFSVTVGFLINLVKSKLDNWLGRRLLGLAEVGWKLAVFLAVPVVAAEGCTPWQALRRSGDLFTKTWGQTIAGDLGIGALQLGAWFVCGILPGAVMFFVGLQHTGAHYLLSVAGAGWILVSLVPVLLLSESILMVFRMVLYTFAVEGVVPEEYKEEDCAWFVAQRG